MSACLPNVLVIEDDQEGRPPMTLTATQETTVTSTDTGELADLLAELAQARYWLTFASRDLTDEQAGSRPTVSQLCLGGLIKHVASTEEGWVRFAVEGASAMGGGWETPEDMDWDDFAASVEQGGEKPDWLVARENEFSLLPGETLAGVIAQYEEIAKRTAETLATLDLDTRHDLPKAPWHEPGSAWSVRRVVLHIISETAQHAGHADMLREHIDGATSM